MQNLSKLTHLLKQNSKVAILGIGSELRGDDAAGAYIAESLMPRFESSKSVVVLNGASAPENFTSEIRRLDPTHLVIIDAADIGKNPGELEFLDASRIKELSFCTHMLPLSVMINFLKEDLTFETVIIGIQPKHTNFGAPMSKEVTETADAMIAELSSILK